MNNFKDIARGLGLVAILAAMLLAIIAIAYGLGYRAGAQKFEQSVQTRVDTIRVDRPVPVHVEARTISFKVPRAMFFERVDTVAVRDTVTVYVSEATVEYRDSNIVATVSGPSIGEWRPHLESYEVFRRTDQLVSTARDRRRWFAVTAGVGVGYTPHGVEPTVGVQAGVVLWSR